MLKFNKSKLIITAVFLFFISFSSFAKTVILSNATSETITDIYLFSDNYSERHITTTLQVKKAENIISKLFSKKDETLPDNSICQIDLKTNTEYTIVFESESGKYYAREHVNPSSSTETLLVEIKDINRTDKNYLTNLRKTISQKLEEQRLSLPYYVVAGLVLFFVTILLIIFINDWRRGNPLKFYKDLTANGVEDIEIIGMALMMIPLMLTLFPYRTEIQKTFLWFFKHKINKDVNINATMITGLASVFMYLAFIVRYGIFKTENISQKLFSALQMIVNCWCIAGLLSMFVGNQVWSVPFLNISSQTLLIIVIAMSWFGAKSIAGFMWIILLICCVSHITEVNNAMGSIGAVYIILFACGLFLQMISRVSVTDLKNDFDGISKKAADQISSDISAAGELTEKTIQTVASISATAVTGIPLPPKKD